MSEENVEIVRRLVDAWNRRDLEALVDLGDPEVSFVNSPTAVEPGTRRGIDEVAAAIRQQWEVLDARWEVDQVFDRGDEIILLGRLSTGMPDSDARIAEPLLVSYRLRDGTLIRAEILGFGVTEVETALEAAGLSE
jgi:ketosteroid isomerase-like protein